MQCTLFLQSIFPQIQQTGHPVAGLSGWEMGCRFVSSSTIYHYGGVIMDAIASQITSLTIVYSIVYTDADQRKHQSSASLAFVPWIHRGPVNSPHKWPVMRKMFPFDDVIMDLHLPFLANLGSNHNTTAIVKSQKGYGSNGCLLGSLLLTWIKSNPSMDN